MLLPHAQVSCDELEAGQAPSQNPPSGGSSSLVQATQPIVLSWSLGHVFQQEASLRAVQGSAHLFSNLQTDIGKHMQKFEQTALRTSLRVPAGLVHPSALPPALDAPHTPADEAKADAQLAELRQRIAEVCLCV